MKNNKTSLLLIVLSAALIASCAADEKKIPSSAQEPGMVIYTYDADGTYNPDNDVRVRFAVNSKTSEAWYLVQPTADVEKWKEENGEENFAAYVKQNGTKLDLAGEIPDVYITDLLGPQTIAGLAVSADGKENFFYAHFTGLTWTTVVSGKYISAIFGETPAELQICDYNEYLYRIKEPFEPGCNIKFSLLPDYVGSDDDGEYVFIRVEPQKIKTHPSKGDIFIRDVGYWQGDDSFVTDYGYEGGMYEDFSCSLCVQYFDASYTNYGLKDDYFVPDSEGDEEGDESNGE